MSAVPLHTSNVLPDHAQTGHPAPLPPERQEKVIAQAKEIIAHNHAPALVGYPKGEMAVVMGQSVHGKSEMVIVDNKQNLPREATSGYARVGDWEAPLASVTTTSAASRTEMRHDCVLSIIKILHFKPINFFLK